MGLTELELVHTLCGKNGIVTPLPSRPEKGYSRGGTCSPLKREGMREVPDLTTQLGGTYRVGGNQAASPPRDAPVGRRREEGGEGRGSLLCGHLRGGEVLLAPILRQVPDLEKGGGTHQHQPTDVCNGLWVSGVGSFIGGIFITNRMTTIPPLAQASLL